MASVCLLFAKYAVAVDNDDPNRAPPAPFCKGMCGMFSSRGDCWCDEDCETYGNCCNDACPACGYGCDSDGDAGNPLTITFKFSSSEQTSVETEPIEFSYTIPDTSKRQPTMGGRGPTRTRSLPVSRSVKR